jgi:hypothetical protein
MIYEKEKRLLDKLRLILATSNFKGAQCLFNLKKKQMLNKKTTGTSNLMLKKEASFLAPITINSGGIGNSSSNSSRSSAKLNRSNNSSGTTSPSSSSISPASSNNLCNLNNNHNNNNNNNVIGPVISHINESINNNSKPKKNIRLVNRELTTVTPPYAVQFCDLNERLFACLLSNFSCKLVENFLIKNSHTNALTSTGFIRKKKSDKSFQFINIFKNENQVNNNSSVDSSNNTKILNSKQNHLISNALNLNIEKLTFKLCLKLDKWPQSYDQSFFNRKRINLQWPSKSVLQNIYLNDCLITYWEPFIENNDNFFENINGEIDEDDDYYYSQSNEEALNISNKYYMSSAKWQICTLAAETTLFRSLNKQQIFEFYYLYLIFMNMSASLTDETKTKLKKTTFNEFDKLKAKITTSSFNKQSLKANKFYMYQIINERIFLHHYFRFLELEESESSTASSIDSNQKQQKTNFNLNLLNLINLLKKFNNYLKFVLEKYKNFNKPNYFDLSKTILSCTELKCLFENTFNVELFDLYDNLNNDMSIALNEFDILLCKNLLSKFTLTSVGFAKTV